MNKEIKELKTIFKDLYNKNIFPYKLMIIEEIEYYNKDKEISDDDYNKLYYEIEDAYFNLDCVSVEAITRCALNNIDRILKNESSFDLKNESCKY